MSIGRALSSAVCCRPIATSTPRTNASKAGGVELGRDAGGHVEERRTRDPAGRRRFVIRRHGLDARLAAQFLQRAENRALPIAEIRAEPDQDGMHTQA